MIITIDTTEELTPKQQLAIAALLNFPRVGPADLGDPFPPVSEEATPTRDEATAAPRRKRRTKAEIAADEAAALAAQRVEDERPPGDGEKHLNEDEPTPDSENAESPSEDVTIDDVVKSATALVSTNKQALVDLLAKYEIRKVSDCPPEKWGALVADMNEALA